MIPVVAFFQRPTAKLWWALISLQLVALFLHQLFFVLQVNDEHSRDIHFAFTPFFFSSISDGQRRTALILQHLVATIYTQQLYCSGRVQCYAFNMLIVLLKPFIMT